MRKPAVGELRFNRPLHAHADTTTHSDEAQHVAQLESQRCHKTWLDHRLYTRTHTNWKESQQYKAFFFHLVPRDTFFFLNRLPWGEIISDFFHLRSVLTVESWIKCGLICRFHSHQTAQSQPQTCSLFIKRGPVFLVLLFIFYIHLGQVICHMPSLTMWYNIKVCLSICNLAVLGGLILKYWRFQIPRFLS